MRGVPSIRGRRAFIFGLLRRRAERYSEASARDRRVLQRGKNVAPGSDPKSRQVGSLQMGSLKPKILRFCAPRRIVSSARKLAWCGGFRKKQGFCAPQPHLRTEAGTKCPPRCAEANLGSGGRKPSAPLPCERLRGGWRTGRAPASPRRCRLARRQRRRAGRRGAAKW